MKLRFRNNSLRFRVNQREVEALASGQTLAESISFPGGASLDYTLRSLATGSNSASFDGKSISVAAPLGHWAKGADLGFYFDLNGLKVSIEKDLECVDAPEDERDPHAYPR
jgi:hypothetical protein